MELLIIQPIDLKLLKIWVKKNQKQNKKGEKSIEEGTKTPLYLIELPSKIDKEKQGHFFENEKKVSIFEEVMW